MFLILCCSVLPHFALSFQEELEESAQTSIYDDYKFLTKEELERLNLTNLIGTNLLRAYMHGFFIDYRLFKKVDSLIYCQCILNFDFVGYAY